jgi:hypothetical protein
LGDSYWEIKEKSDAIVVEFLSDEEDIEQDVSIENLTTMFSVDYEFSIETNQEMETDSDYRAEVTARIKPRR